MSSPPSITISNIAALRADCSAVELSPTPANSTDMPATHLPNNEIFGLSARYCLPVRAAILGFLMFGFPAVLGIERASPVVLAQFFDLTQIAHSSPSILLCCRLPANHTRNSKAPFYGPSE